MSVTRAVADRIVAAGLGNVDLTASGTGWLVLEGLVTDREPVQGRPQVAVSRAGGRRRGMTHNGSPGTVYARVQAVARGVPDDYFDTEAQVDALVADLHQRVLTVNGKRTLVQLEEEPIWLGYTEQDRRPMWSINFMTYMV